MSKPKALAFVSCDKARAEKAKDEMPFLITGVLERGLLNGA